MWQRLRARFWLKAIGTTTFMWLFFAGYFHVLRYPQHAAAQMPLTPLDHWIGFQPWALWPYVSLWAYVALPPALMPNARDLIRYGWWVGGLCVAGLACFYVWPTAVPMQLSVAPSYAGFELLRGVDATGNACPSLHVAAATFSALWLERLLRELALPRGWRAANALWYALIVWSTLAIKQHVWWDVVAGLLLAVVFALPSLRWVSRERGSDIMTP
ncbi:MAG TPA: phosphatase PAP2 family protein [Burkholderiaceae bacterium]|nr:phosphatase PAP2 family protein [Burkholderiaceae bacterium]